MSYDKKSTSWPGWETVRLIGQGGFGTVYEIQRDIFGDIERAALKVISIPQNSSDIDEMYSDGYDEETVTNTFQEHLKSIVAEYSMMRKMNGCANIVSCDDVRYVRHNDGIGWDIFIKMELLTPLTKTLATTVDEETVIKIARDMCTALEICKRHGIIHRDIKPQNIFLSPNGDYKLGDFGIAKAVEKTMGGTKIGTYKYMAPEVYNNRPYGSAADIYSLGLVLYWLLNERRMPFLPLPPAKINTEMEERARIRRLYGEKLPEPQNGSKQLKKIVMKACEYNAKDRYSSASEMLMDISQVAQMTPGAAMKPAVMLSSEAASPKAASHGEKDSRTESLFWDTVSDNATKTEEETVALFFKEKKSEPAPPKAPQVPLRADKVIFKDESRDIFAQNRPADNYTATKKKKGKLYGVIGVAAAALLIITLLKISNNLLFGTGKATAGKQDSHTAAEQTATYSTQSPETTPAQGAGQIPEGIKLVDSFWGKGSFNAVALDEDTIWMQLTLDYPKLEYKDLGVPWEIWFDFGEEMRIEHEDGSNAVSYPFRIHINSAAHSELLAIEYEQGNIEYFEEERLRPLCFYETKMENDHFISGEKLYEDLNIEKADNTYTAVVTLPEWFDVSLYDDLVEVSVKLCDTKHWSDLYEKGSAEYIDIYTLEPYQGSQTAVLPEGPLWTQLAEETTTQETMQSPDGEKLIEAVWGSGNLMAVALDENTMWIQITDDRSELEYEDLGIPWQLRFELGEILDGAGDDNSHLFEFTLDSPARCELEAMALKKSGWMTADIKEQAKALGFYKLKPRTEPNTQYYEKYSYDDVNVEREGNTYTAIVTLPEWFDVSVRDLKQVEMEIHDDTYLDILYNHLDDDKMWDYYRRYTFDT